MRPCGLECPACCWMLAGSHVITNGSKQRLQDTSTVRMCSTYYIWTTLDHVGTSRNGQTKPRKASPSLLISTGCNRAKIYASLYPHPTSAARADHVEKSDPFPCSCRPGHVRACRPCACHILCFQVVKCARTDPFPCDRFVWYSLQI
jgi:hypothetical protein